MKTTDRDYYVEMAKAEKLLADCNELRKTTSRVLKDEDVALASQETLNMYNRQITAMATEANARIALAHLYYITG